MNTNTTGRDSLSLHVAPWGQAPWLFAFCLHRERTTTSASRLGVGVAHAEAALVKFVMEVNGCTADVEQALAVSDDAYAIDLEEFIVLGIVDGVKVQACS